MEKNIAIMSAAQYARALKGTQSYNNKQAVNYRIRNKLPLFAVIRSENILGRNVLYINKLKISRLKLEK